MADNRRRSSKSTNKQTDKLADHFRKLADQVEDARHQVRSSFSSTDPQKRMDLLREWGNQLIMNALPIISWFEKNLHPDAAHIEKLRLTNIADEAVACAASSQPQYADGRVKNSAPGERLTSAQRRLLAFNMEIKHEATSLRDWASKIDKEQKKVVRRDRRSHRKKSANEKIREQRNKFSRPRRKKDMSWSDIYSAYTKKYPKDKKAGPDTLRLSYERNPEQE